MTPTCPPLMSRIIRPMKTMMNPWKEDSMTLHVLLDAIQ